MRRIIPSLFLLALSCGPALASGGIGCEAKDGNAEIALSSGVTRGMGAPLFNLTGSLKTRLEGIGEDLRTIEYGTDNVSQWWIDRQQLNLLLYAERQEEPFGSTELTITTRSVEEGAYEGEYVVVSYDGDIRAEITGAISCIAE